MISINDDQAPAGALPTTGERKPVKALEAATAPAPAVTDTKPPKAAGGTETSDPSPSADEDRPGAKQLKVANQLLEDVANGTIPFDLKSGNEPIKICTYGHALATVLADTLGTDRKRTVLLALCCYARALTSTPVSDQNDLAMQLRALQFVGQDLTFETEELATLTLAISNQEAIAGRA